METIHLHLNLSELAFSFGSGKLGYTLSMLAKQIADNPETEVPLNFPFLQSLTNED